MCPEVLLHIRGIFGGISVCVGGVVVLLVMRCTAENVVWDKLLRTMLRRFNFA